jgi:hypothetical protein
MKKEKMEVKRKGAVAAIEGSVIIRIFLMPTGTPRF